VRSQDLLIFFSLSLLLSLLLSKELYPRLALLRLPSRQLITSLLQYILFLGWCFSLVLTTDDSGREEWAWQRRAERNGDPIDSA
jgi:hypothetical protein